MPGGHQGLLGALAQLLHQALLAQRLAFIWPLFDVDQRHRWAGLEIARTGALLVGRKPSLRVVTDTAVQRTVGGAYQVNEPGFGNSW
ncbi:hypothetical protein D3C79_1016560 [compost metagenome]